MARVGVIALFITSACGSFVDETALLQQKLEVDDNMVVDDPRKRSGRSSPGVMSEFAKIQEMMNNPEVGAAKTVAAPVAEVVKAKLVPAKEDPSSRMLFKAYKEEGSKKRVKGANLEKGGDAAKAFEESQQKSAERAAEAEHRQLEAEAAKQAKAEASEEQELQVDDASQRERDEDGIEEISTSEYITRDNDNKKLMEADEEDVAEGFPTEGRVTADLKPAAFTRILPKKMQQRMEKKAKKHKKKKNVLSTEVGGKDASIMSSFFTELEQKAKIADSYSDDPKMLDDENEDIKDFGKKHLLGENRKARRPRHFYELPEDLQSIEAKALAETVTEEEAGLTPEQTEALNAAKEIPAWDVDEFTTISMENPLIAQEMLKRFIMEESRELHSVPVAQPRKLYSEPEEEVEEPKPEDKYTNPLMREVAKLDAEALQQSDCDPKRGCHFRNVFQEAANAKKFWGTVRRTLTHQGPGMLANGTMNLVKKVTSNAPLNFAKEAMVPRWPTAKGGADLTELFQQLEGHGWCSDKQGKSLVNQKSGTGDECRQACSLDETCPGFAVTSSKEKCVYYSDQQPEISGVEARFFRIHSSTFTASEREWRGSHCFKKTKQELSMRVAAGKTSWGSAFTKQVNDMKEVLVENTRNVKQAMGDEWKRIKEETKQNVANGMIY